MVYVTNPIPSWTVRGVIHKVGGYVHIRFHGVGTIVVTGENGYSAFKKSGAVLLVAKKALRAAE